MIHEQKSKKQSTADKPDNSSVPDKQKTLDEAICPLYAHEDELLVKQRLVRNALQHQAERLLRGQTVQSQFDIYKSHTLERQMPRFFADAEVRARLYKFAEIVSGQVKEHYRTKGEFQMQLDDAGKVRIGNQYRVQGEQIHVFSATEMQQARVFPRALLRAVLAAETALQTELDDGRLEIGKFESWEQKNIGQLTAKCSGEVKGAEFEVEQILLRF